MIRVHVICEGQTEECLLFDGWLKQIEALQAGNDTWEK